VESQDILRRNASNQRKRKDLSRERLDSRSDSHPRTYKHTYTLCSKTWTKKNEEAEREGLIDNGDEDF
jgi:hypothetical protein